jgi:hypothetical protein
MGVNDLVGCPAKSFVLQRDLANFNVRAGDDGFAIDNLSTSLDIWIWMRTNCFVYYLLRISLSRYADAYLADIHPMHDWPNRLR